MAHSQNHMDVLRKAKKKKNNINNTKQPFLSFFCGDFVSFWVFSRPFKFSRSLTVLIAEMRVCKCLFFSVF